jgi:hypothetical protein
MKSDPIAWLARMIDVCGRPILLKITDGQAHDGRSARDMLGSLATCGAAGEMPLADQFIDPMTSLASGPHLAFSDL